MFNDHGYLADNGLEELEIILRELIVELDTVQLDHSDDLILSGKRLESSARNSFPGIVRNIIKKSSVIEVILDIGVVLTIDITRKSYEEMNIDIGDKLWATFKVSALKVFEH